MGVVFTNVNLESGTKVTEFRVEAEENIASKLGTERNTLPEIDTAGDTVPKPGTAENREGHCSRAVDCGSQCKLGAWDKSDRVLSWERQKTVPKLGTTINAIMSQEWEETCLRVGDSVSQCQHGAQNKSDRVPSWEKQKTVPKLRTTINDVMS